MIPIHVENYTFHQCQMDGDVEVSIRGIVVGSLILDDPGEAAAFEAIKTQASWLRDMRKGLNAVEEKYRDETGRKIQELQRKNDRLIEILKEVL